MGSDCLRLICDGQVEIIKITEDLYEEAAKLFYNSFIQYENVSIACDIAESPEAINEMMILMKTKLKDNISFAARDIKTQELVAICVNKLLTLKPTAHITVDEVFDSFKTPNMKVVGEYLNTLECTNDIFKKWQIDCVIELSFLSTRVDYGRRGIAVALTKYLLDYAAKLKAVNGENEFQQQLPEHIRGQKPQAIMAVFTSRHSQIVGEKLDFEILFKVENSKFAYEGKTFAEKLDPIHKYSVFAAKRL